MKLTEEERQNLTELTKYVLDNVQAMEEVFELSSAGPTQ